MLTSLEFGVGVRIGQNFTVFRWVFAHFFSNAVQSYSHGRFWHCLCVQYRFIALRYSIVEKSRVKQSNSYQFAFRFITLTFVYTILNFRTHSKNVSVNILNFQNVQNGANLADTDPRKWVSSSRSTLLRSVYFILYYVWGMCAGIGKITSQKLNLFLRYYRFHGKGGGRTYPPVVVVGVQILVVLSG